MSIIQLFTADSARAVATTVDDLTRVADSVAAGAEGIATDLSRVSSQWSRFGDEADDVIRTEFGGVGTAEAGASQTVSTMYFGRAAEGVTLADARIAAIERAIADLPTLADSSFGQGVRQARTAIDELNGAMAAVTADPLDRERVTVAMRSAVAFVKQTETLPPQGAEAGAYWRGVTDTLADLEASMTIRGGGTLAVMTDDATFLGGGALA